MGAGFLGLTAIHALFAGANFDIGQPGEGAVVALAAVALAAATVLVFRGTWSRAGWVALLGTVPLVVWFVITVPLGWSDAMLLYMSLFSPAVAAGVIFFGNRGTTG